MRRREFIMLLGGAPAWPLSARAQQQSTMPMVGFLSGWSLASDARLVAAFRQGLNETGYVEGRNVVIEYRWAEGQFDRLSVLAADLVGRQVAVVFAGGLDVETRTVRVTISTIPIVFATAGDPVELGLVASFNRPGGNATAVTLITAALWPKRFELLHELVTSANSIALLVNPNDPNAEPSTSDVQAAMLVNPNSPETEAERREVPAAAQAIGQQLIILDVSSGRDIEIAFATLLQRGADALFVGTGAFLYSNRERVVALAARHAIPAIYTGRDAVVAGGLMSYGSRNQDAYRHAGIYAGRILKGEGPADLPVRRLW